MKQLSSLLSKLIRKDKDKYLIRGYRIDCPMTTLGGSISVKHDGVGLTAPVSWLSHANLALLSSGAEIVIEDGRHIIRSAQGAEVPLAPIAEDGDGTADHTIKYALPEEFEAEGSITIETEQQRAKILALCALPITDDKRYIYSGLHLELSQPTALRLWVTDGRVAGELTADLALKLFDKPTGPHEDPTIPFAALTKLLAFKKVDYLIMWSATRFRITFVLDGYTVVYEDNLLEGKFPDISRVIPQYTHSIPFNGAAFAAVKWTKNLPSNPIKFRVEPAAETYYAFRQLDDDGNLTCMHTNSGQTDESRVYIAGAVNHAYMTSVSKLLGDDAEFHAVIETDKNAQLISVDGYLRPLYFTSTDCKALVMPMKV